jgi:hypothetical protein
MLTDTSMEKVTSRDLDTMSPDHMKEIRRESFLVESILRSSKQASMEEDDDEDKAWKQEQKDVVIPQEYVDAQFRKRMRGCAKSFEVIMAEAASISKCDVCSNTIDTPHIARGCSHCFCMKCLRVGSDSDDESVVEIHQEEEAEEPESESCCGTPLKRKKKKKTKSFAGDRVLCPVCEMDTEARADDAMASFLQKLQVFGFAKGS